MPRPSPRDRRPGALLAALAVTAWVAVCAAAAPVTGRPAAPAGPWPDTVLARVGATRMVTVARFRRAWAETQDPQHPQTLTPEAAREFLDLMISKEALGERALAARVPWSHRDSLMFEAFRDRVMMKAVLDSALEETARRRAAAGEPRLERMDLGVAARESAMTRLDVRYDTTLAAHLARLWKALPVAPGDSSMLVQYRMRERMPDVPAADTGRVVARSSIGDYRVSELVRQWGWLDPWTRPRLETPEAVEEMVRNGLFERLLRGEAGARHLERRPDLAGAIANQREYAAVSAYVAREVYARIHPDSLAMTRWYRAHPDAYRLPDRARIARWMLPDRAGAGRLAALLRDASAADSLIARGSRHGADFRDEITAASDSALFADAMRLGPGTVLGPDTLAGAWRVVRVLELEPARVRSFDEARPYVLKDMTDSLGEAGMKALVGRVRRETPVRLHPRAIQLMLAAH